ncbi:ribosome silencing factor [Fundicoccus culcitae]|uniref:Ribosomal silencing factor RsfS n=1 Tax=Fundicoccus culcitae TaxID=2969821 RepID=A0ABY5P6J4_9LACT|nr:ribosome silencing factor [Fundicoccus culcitae]UUX34201.1 ribosome silencing factor [Fundicoccus culcitae]
MGQTKLGGIDIKTVKEKLELIVKAIDDRFGQDIVALEVKDLTPLVDYFVVTHASNDRQLDAIVEAVKDVVEENEIPLKNIEGKDGGKWVLIDLNDIVVHVFYYSERLHYNLEKVWQDAPLVNLSEWINVK